MKLKLLPLLALVIVATSTTYAERVVVVANRTGNTLNFNSRSIPLEDFVYRDNSAFRGLFQLENDLEEVTEELDRLNERLNEVAALNAALDFQRPAPGKSHRVFTGFGQFQDKTAVGIGITGVYKNFDYGIGASFSANQMLTKGSIGWSF
ncbi:MAG TPA: prefoldin domain-containing protein [Chthoniobacterales bacterium]|jgi:hypothetical protein